MGPGGVKPVSTWTPAVSRAELPVRLPLGFALGSPIFPSSCEGKPGVALESLQGPRDLT